VPGLASWRPGRRVRTQPIDRRSDPFHGRWRWHSRDQFS
jgi:hypothetical protein